MARMPGSFDYEEDEWHERDFHRAYGYVQPPRAPPPPRRSGDLLNPADFSFGTSRRRSRSTGNSPAPNIYVYNHNDVVERDASPSRGRTSEIADRLGDIDRDIRRLSRSRGPEFRSSSPYEQQLALEERWRLREADAEIARLQRDRRTEHDLVDRTRDEELIRRRLELDRLRDQIRADQESSKWEDREKTLKQKLKLKELEDEMKTRADEQRRKDERDKILFEQDQKIIKAKQDREKLLLELKAKEEEEEKERKQLVAAAMAKEAEKKKQQDQEEKDAIARYEQKKIDEKAKQDALRAQFKAEEEEKKRKDKEEAEKWKFKIKMEEEEEKEKKKKHEKELEDEMRKKLSVFGIQNNQIEAIMDPKKAANLPVGYSPANPRRRSGQLVIRETPTYIKVHRDHLDVETLRYYNLKWEYDAVDPNYIVILEEIDERETEYLFAHTRKLRRGSKTLLTIEETRRGRDSQLAFVRRRRPSASPSRKKDKSPIRIGLF